MLSAPFYFDASSLDLSKKYFLAAIFAEILPNVENINLYANFTVRFVIR